MSEVDITRILLPALRIISKYYEQFEILVKPLGVDLRVEHDELDIEDIKILLRIINELKSQGVNVNLIISPAVTEGEPVIKTIFSLPIAKSM